jgi:hypothetical protein
MFTEFYGESLRYRLFERPKQREYPSGMFLGVCVLRSRRGFALLIMKGSGTGRFELSNFTTI